MLVYSCTLYIEELKVWVSINCTKYLKFLSVLLLLCTYFFFWKIFYLPQNECENNLFSSSEKFDFQSSNRWIKSDILNLQVWKKLILLKIGIRRIVCKRYGLNQWWKNLEILAEFSFNSTFVFVTIILLVIIISRVYFKYFPHICRQCQMLCFLSVLLKLVNKSYQKSRCLVCKEFVWETKNCSFMIDRL